MYVHIGYAYQFLYGELAQSNKEYPIINGEGESDVNPDNDEIEDNGHYMATLIES